MDVNKALSMLRIVLVLALEKPSTTTRAITNKKLFVLRLPRGHFFAALSTKSLARYVDRNENFVLVVGLSRVPVCQGGTHKGVLLPTVRFVGILRARPWSG